VFKSRRGLLRRALFLARRAEVIVMAAILDQGAMAYLTLGRGCLHPVILPFQLRRAKIPVNFLLFTGSLDSLSHKLCFRVRRRADRNGCRLTRQHQTIAAVVYWWPSWSDCATIFSVFRERSQLPRTKRPGKTIVKTMFGHEQHDAWPNEPDWVRQRRAFWPNEPRMRKGGVRAIALGTLVRR
jgi:hypothetical protein